MKIQLIRHATMLLSIKNKKILVDPMLSPKGTMSAVPNVSNTNNNPLIDLPVDLQTLIDVNAILVTHTHRDHFDDTAMEFLPKDIPVFCQVEDANKIQSAGFLYVHPIQQSHKWNDIIFYRTGGQHGTGEIGEKMGTVSGFALMTNGEPSLYIMGDTIWCSEVEEILEIYQPQIAISFAGSAQFSTGNPITMTANDIYNICNKAPYTKIIVTHMEAWNHCSLSRKELKYFLKKEYLSKQVYVPYDGELMNYDEK